MRRLRWSEQDLARVAELRAAGVAAGDIAREFGVSTSRIAQVVRLYGLPRAARTQVSVDLSGVVRQMVAAGLTGAEIGARLDVSSQGRGGSSGRRDAVPGSVPVPDADAEMGGVGSTRASGPPVVPQGDWVSRAACVGAPEDWFFSTDATCVRVGKALCSVCPVRAECLEWAVRTDQVGLWGGLTDKERRRLGKQDRRSSVGG